MSKKSKKVKLPIAKSSADLIPAVNYKETKDDVARRRRYAAEDGLRAIQRAEEIKSDTRLMSDIKSLAKEQVNNLKKFVK